MEFSARHRSGLYAATLPHWLCGLVWLFLNLPLKWEMLVIVPTSQVNVVSRVRLPCGIACVSASTTVTSFLHSTAEPQLEESGIYAPHLPAPPLSGFASRW